MGSEESFEEVVNNFSDIFIERNSDYDSDDEFFDSFFGKAPPGPPRMIKKPIDFERYVQENFQNKIKILDRLTFHHIQRPIIIFFNHFREKCTYHTEWLDRLYQLALKYGEQLEFIAADMLDIDVINSKWHSIEFYCVFVNPDRESPITFAIDQKKRIHQHYDAYKTVENLSELCENLLNGKLYPSQPLPDNNDEKLVKICVHNNYEDLVLKSSKDILLIVGLGEMPVNDKYEPNYDNVARELKNDNVDVIYMDADKNYVPFELSVYSYPTLFYIPRQDKTQFMTFLNGARNEENVLNCFKKYLGKPNAFQLKQQEEMSTQSYNPLKISENFKLDFEDLKEYFQENCKHYIKLYELEYFNNIKNKNIVIIFMDFRGTCLPHHHKWLDKIYQLSIRFQFETEFLIADFKDIDIINPQWNPKDFINEKNNKPKIYGLDRHKNKFELKDLKTIGSIFYFLYSLTRNELYYSALIPKFNGQVVTTCVADNINLFIKGCKKHIFLTIYWPTYKESGQVLKILNELSRRLKRNDMLVKLVIMDARVNYVPLEFHYHTYPVHYFIPKNDKTKFQRLISKCKEEIFNFIKNNVELRKEY